MLRNRKYLLEHGMASTGKQCIPYRLVKLLRNRKYLPEHELPSTSNENLGTSAISCMFAFYFFCTSADSSPSDLVRALCATS
jgi:hypothetical protein